MRSLVFLLAASMPTTLACDFQEGTSSTTRSAADDPPPDGSDAGARDSSTPPARDAGVVDPVSPDAGSGSPPPASTTPYPRGPYGTTVGDTMPDLWFTKGDGSEITWRAIRSDPSVRVIVWGSGAGWCGPCRAEAPKMSDLHDRYASRGLYVVESLFEDESRRMATPEYVRRWEAELDTTHAVFAEPDPPYGEASAIPMLWVIDAETMEILHYANGLEYGVESLVEAALSRSSRRP